MKFNILLAVLLLFSVKAFSQTLSKEQFNAIKLQLPHEKDEAKKAALYYKAARYCLAKEGEVKQDVDSAALLNSWSGRISKTLGLKKGIAQSMLLDGEIAMEQGNKSLAARLKNKALSYAVKNGFKKEQADAYNSLAQDVPYEDFAKKAGYFKKGAALYKSIGADINEAETFCELSIIYNGIDQAATSIWYAQQSIKIKKSIRRYDLYKEFTMLGLNLRVQGNYKDALAYALAAERISENTAVDKIWLSVIYDLIGTIYSEMKFYGKSVEYYKKAIATAKEIDDRDAVYAITLNTARGLYNRGRTTQALDILNGGYKYYHGNNCDAEFPSLYILIYCKLKKYNKAKPYYEQLLQCDIQNKGMYKDHLGQEKMYYAMIHYLIKTGQARATYTYLDKLKKLGSINNDLLNLSQIEKAHFESDSATGNYPAAIEHLKKHKQLNDSLYNINSTKQFASLQLKYETEKKDKNIKLLKQKSELQNIRLQHEVIMRYIFIGSLILLFIVLGLLFSQYCLKQRNNKKLEAKQEEINRQNKILRRLVDEKEWLLKEIHHRVKNNLQIVISLLNTQSAYLDNKDALLAIQNSQHRMHAMSLIHQKLYQSDNLASIDMAWYIYELVNYLRECFDTDRKISFELDTEKMELDVAQAVPLGLILNEAISNAIKYAFPSGERGIVKISLKKTGEDSYQLIISDNGIGLPDDFEHENRDSLGMSLMVGLTDQLDGSFSIESNNGLSVIIAFTKKQKLTEADDRPQNVQEN